MNTIFTMKDGEVVGTEQKLAPEKRKNILQMAKRWGATDPPVFFCVECLQRTVSAEQRRCVECIQIIALRSQEDHSQQSRRLWLTFLAFMLVAMIVTLCVAEMMSR